MVEQPKLRRDGATLQASIACGLAVFVGGVCAIGAPPSEFVVRTDIWDALFLPALRALGAGFVVAVVGAACAMASARIAAWACIVAVPISAFGVVVMWMNDAEVGAWGLFLPLVLLALPLALATGVAARR